MDIGDPPLVFFYLFHIRTWSTFSFHLYNNIILSFENHVNVLKYSTIEISSCNQRYLSFWSTFYLNWSKYVSNFFFFFVGYTKVGTLKSRIHKFLSLFILILCNFWSGSHITTRFLNIRKQPFICCWTSLRWHRLKNVWIRQSFS